MGQGLIGTSAIKHFAGSRECAISQSDIYLAPIPLKPGVSPFCKNRATLLEALSNGGRYGFDEPFVGKGKKSSILIGLLVHGLQVARTHGSPRLKYA